MITYPSCDSFCLYFQRRSKRWSSRSSRTTCWARFGSCLTSTKTGCWTLTSLLSPCTSCTSNSTDSTCRQNCPITWCRPQKKGSKKITLQNFESKPLKRQDYFLYMTSNRFSMIIFIPQSLSLATTHGLFSERTLVEKISQNIPGTALTLF